MLFRHGFSSLLCTKDHCDCAWLMFRLDNMQSTFRGTFPPCEDQTKRVIRDCGGAAMHRVTMIDWSQQESFSSISRLLALFLTSNHCRPRKLTRHSATDIWWRFLLEFETALVHS